MEYIFEKVYPAPGKKKENETMMNEKPTKKKATFVVQVQYREHATWQGTINWVEKNEEKPFRSALELIKLIDSATEETEI